MNKVIENDIARVEISTLGAEVISFKTLKDDCEYLWNGDKQYWASHAPVLFPLVCAVDEGKIKVGGKEYAIGNHGFARKSEFSVVEDTDSSVTYKLPYSEETLKMYPFKFNLFITYALTGNKLDITYKVENVDNKEIYFLIGTHPGFNCPLAKDEKFEDYYLEFECNETLERLFMNAANVLIKDKSEMILQDKNIIPLTRKLFQDGALVFKNINSRKISLKSNKSDKEVIVSFDDLPYLGLWQAKDAPFVCIEPWHGIADVEGYNGEFKEKEMIIELGTSKSYECNYSIEVK
ncbi:aldose 1-epimerase family protein [Petroclostridium sp. X23]|uniref:aldose 1-epimerase family protein n=1 Tax=Petroclostridium sp. X23 TaxID=3045146 RepID=UPI0024ACD7CA|nr:aldose 1-epimerase family protein [Petroclostridium sp. X23]WHH59516.1 aldose 1-epimerase family protein [Petroclostridium sp. X23]